MAKRDTNTGAVAHGTRAEREQRGIHESEAHTRFGGINWGAAFFGWLVAVAVSLLLTSVIGAVAAALGSSANVTQDQAEREAGAIGLAAAITLVVVLLIGFYAGGYVAGRMSRFDGGRQGVGVWLIGLILALVAIGLGALFGSQYNVLDRVNLPGIPISADAATWGGIITAVAILVGTLLTAMFGGKVGHRYHNKVDHIVDRRG